MEGSEKKGKGGIREWSSFGKHNISAIASHKLFPKGSFPVAKQKPLKALPLFCFQKVLVSIGRTNIKL